MEIIITFPKNAWKRGIPILMRHGAILIGNGYILVKVEILEILEKNKVQYQIRSIHDVNSTDPNFLRYREQILQEETDAIMDINYGEEIAEKAEEKDKE